MTSSTQTDTNSFDQLLERLPSDPNAKGKAFEQVCKWFLQTDPAYANELSNVWTWDEWPQRWGPDIGIDLVAETHEGNLWAIQAKGYDPNTRVPTHDIDSFISASSRPEFSHRLLISTGEISGNAEYKLAHQDKSTSFLLYTQLMERPVNWLAFYDQSLEPIPEVKTPRPHQQEAIKHVIAGFKTNDRGRLIMACGTGKTLVGLWIDQELKTSSTLVLMPSLALVSQVSHEWLANVHEEFRTLYVCSDQTVKDDTFVANPGQLGSPVTTDPQDIHRFLSMPGKKVIFSTYQSSPQISKALELGPNAFDLIIADEAHHCTGKVDSAFSQILDSNKLKGYKRLFMTATPRYVSGRVRDAASLQDIRTASMDDEQQFGPEFHVLTFGHAIEKTLLSDYQVVIMGVTDSEVSALTQDRRLVELFESDFRTDAESMASMIGMLKAIRAYGLRRILTFHSRVSRASGFASDFAKLNSTLDPILTVLDLKTDYVSGIMSTKDRNQRMQGFRNGTANVYLLSNARCLGEGVDVRAIDGIGFIDPRRSIIDITQAVGRAIRKSDTEKIGTIILPVFIDENTDESPSEHLNRSRFKAVWDVVNALRSYDEVLAEELDTLRYQIGRRGPVGLRIPGKVIIDIPTNVGSDFIDAIESKIVETSTSSWEFWYGLLERYVEECGNAVVPNAYEQNGLRLGAWVENQRSRYRRHVLQEERIDRLERFETWSWDEARYDKIWEEHFIALQNYASQFGNAMVPGKHKQDGFTLGRWVEKQRGAYRKARLSSTKINALETVDGWNWNGQDLEKVWDANYADLLSFVEKNGHTKVPMVNSDPLARWISKQRQAYKSGTLSNNRIVKLNGLNGWVWHTFDSAWETGFTALQAFHAREGHANVPQSWYEGSFSLGNWISHQRSRYVKRLDWADQRSSRSRSSPLSDDQITALNGLGLIWNAREAKDRAAFNLGLNAYKNYVTEFGTYRVSPGYRSEDGFNLDTWMQSNRRRYAGKRGHLLPDQIAALEDIAGINAEVILAPLRKPNRAK